MSDVSQGEGWWVASDGRWYPPKNPNDRPDPPSQVSIPQGVAGSDSADEHSTDRSAVAGATARQCVNGHEMPESHVFCSVCGSEQWEGYDDEEYVPGRSRPSLQGVRRWIGGEHFYEPVAETHQYGEELDDDDEVSVGGNIDMSASSPQIRREDETQTQGFLSAEEQAQLPTPRRTRKWAYIVGACVVGALVVGTSIGAATSGSGDSNSTPTTAAAASGMTTQQKAFVNKLGTDPGGDFNTPDLTADQAIAWGNGVCEDFAAGDSVYGVDDDANTVAYTYNHEDYTNFLIPDVIFLIKDATATLCPAYGSETQGLAALDG